MTLFLNGESLTIKEIKKLLNQDLKIDISEDAIERVKKSRQVVERIIENKETIYGITTGFGLFSDVLIDPSQYNELQVNLIRSCLLYTSPSPRDKRQSRMPSSA